MVAMLSSASVIENSINLSIKESEDYVFPEIIGKDEIEANGYVKRLKNEETNLNTLVFRNSNGTNTARMFGFPVKYYDDKGNVVDISLKLNKDSTGNYSAFQHCMETTFPARISDGIKLKYNDLDIKMVPTVRQNAKAIQKDDRRISYSIDDSTSYEYSLTYTGFKEDIVVSEYTGQTEYEFIIYTNGLSLSREKEQYFLKNAEGDKKAVFGDIIITSADEKNNTLGYITTRTIEQHKIYGITIHVDENYLTSTDTVYPITIDPSIEYPYTGIIEDITLNSDDNIPNGSSGSIHVGKRATYGKSRILMRFPGFDYSLIDDYNKIISANVEIRDLMCQTDVATVYCYTALCSWSESTATWNNTSGGNPGVYNDENDISYDIGYELPIRHRYSFDITKAFTLWFISPGTRSGGIVFKMSDTVESGSSYVSRTFASYDRATNQPSLKVTYITTELLDNGIIHTFENTSSSQLMIPISSSINATIETQTFHYSKTKLMWKLEYADNGYYKIKNDVTGYYLTAPANNNNGSSITQGLFNGNYSLWCFIKNSDGSYMVQSKNQYIRNAPTPLYLSTSETSVVQKSGSCSWNVKPLIMRINAYYDQSFCTLYGTLYGTNYLNVLHSIFGNNSINNSIAKLYKERFGILVKVSYNQAIATSYPEIHTCTYVNSIETLCNDCHNEGSDIPAVECRSGLHHKAELSFLGTIPNEYLYNSSQINMYFTGYKACYGVVNRDEFDEIIDSETYHQNAPYANAWSGTNRNDVLILAYTARDNIATGNYDTIIKTVSHELLHNLSVQHCDGSVPCIMKGANTYICQNLPICDICYGTANSNKLKLYNHT